MTRSGGHRTQGQGHQRQSPRRPAQISIEDDGTVFVGATDGPSAQAAIDKINAIANPQLPMGERFELRSSTTDFRAFVSLLPAARSAHISTGRRRASRRSRDAVNVAQLRGGDRRHRQRGDLPILSRRRGDTCRAADAATATADPAAALAPGGATTPRGGAASGHRNSCLRTRVGRGGSASIATKALRWPGGALPEHLLFVDAHPLCRDIAQAM